MFFINKTKIKIGELKPTKPTDYSVGNEYLIDEIKNKGYDNDRSKILVDKDLKIIDGHHRTELIKKNYGIEKQVEVHKIGISNKLFWSIFYLIFLISPIFILLSFIFNSLVSLPINTLKKYINGFKRSRSRNQRDIE